MSRLKFHFWASALVTACSIGALAQANSQCDPHSQYFPPGALNLTPEDSSREVWYGCALTALAEPSLFESKNDKTLQIYRFLWLRTFHHPVSVRLRVDSNGTGIIVTKLSDGAGGYEPGKLIKNTSIDASQLQVQEFQEQLQKLDFWSMSTELPRASSHKLASGNSVVTPPPVDGSQWILEGLRDGTYHVVDRWSPGNGGYAKLCQYLLQLGMVEEKDIY
jgi:hypothetical protein